MQRFKQSNMDLHQDGEWVRYSDHAEAMKRIAGAPVAEGLTPTIDSIWQKMDDYAQRRTSPENIADVLNALARAAPSASVQYAKREDAPYAPLSVPSASPAALTDEHIFGIVGEVLGQPLIAEDLREGFAVHTEPRDWLNFARALLAASPADPDIPEATRLLAMMCDGYENGQPCYEDPDDGTGYMGNAFQIAHEDFDAMCSLLNRRKAPRFDVRKDGLVVPEGPSASPAALTDYSYQQLFDAIAAATRVSGTYVAISVADFRAALLAASPFTNQGN